jgi:hypothetical protein
LFFQRLEKIRSRQRAAEAQLFIELEALNVVLQRHARVFAKSKTKQKYNRRAPGTAALHAKAKDEEASR